ncbi:hypothetical protein OL234_10555 (plasmid) [Vagococcus intermedius]|uniref:Uncharacterized protein n=1 Tax=Vagococcus intermedius TaxID=2991418 RepID=A0AAF0CWX8_9ENTE|nr:hypothetical protein [Vagococcus intermedius]WEG74397.1 hypothetical protein OL234_10555 [Vagococcus intermedius]
MNSLDKKFAGLNDYNREIAERKEELRLREEDHNVGGGRSNVVGNPVETQVIKELSDQYIINRQIWKKSIIETIDNQSSEVRSLIENKYFGEDSWMDWRSFGKKHGYAHSSIYRIRQKVLLEFGRRIGELK